MIKEAKQLIDTMIAEIMMASHNGKGSISKAEIDSCFQISSRYWFKFKREIAGYEFENATDEIYFFKNLKPLFTAEIEYYSLLYHTELFKEATKDPAELEHLWIRESNRFKTFKERNFEFYSYYKNGETKNDSAWFVRTNSDKTSTSYDKLVAKVIALERYDVYVQKRIKELTPVGKSNR